MLQGGGWCNTRRNCIYRKTTRRGSSNFMEKVLPFTGILSNKAEENPGLFSNPDYMVTYCQRSLLLSLSLSGVFTTVQTECCLTKVVVKSADFFNWNRVKIRYCDGASFAGDSEDKVGGTLGFSGFHL